MVESKEEKISVTVYMDNISKERLIKASELDKRSLSNYLLHNGLKRAKELDQSGNLFN